MDIILTRISSFNSGFNGHSTRDALLPRVPLSNTARAKQQSPYRSGSPVVHARSFPDDQLIIFDTTLRDGCQAPGASIGIEEKLQLARQLDQLGVNVIEAGFPVSSNANFGAVQRIAQEVGNKAGQEPPTIASFARTVEGDIDKAWAAVKSARYPRIHIVGTGSDIHLKAKYQPNGRSREKNLEIIKDSVLYAKHLMQKENREVDIEFSPEDCGRADRDYLVQLFRTAIQAGATTVNIPDTVGVLSPNKFKDLMQYLIKKTSDLPGAKKVVWSTHIHNDYGLATANTVFGIQGGARQVEVTVNGIGERAGNCSLEQIVAIAHDFPEEVRHLSTTIKPELLPKTSHLVSSLTRLPLAPNTPVVGKNIFTHESGLHQDGILKSPEVYQAQNPKTYGRKIMFTLGPQSGTAGVVAGAKRLGYHIPKAREREFYTQHFSPLADKLHSVSDAELKILLETLPWVKTKVAHAELKKKSEWVG
jgi:2-isopropylmalate synthase